MEDTKFVCVELHAKVEPTNGERKSNGSIETEEHCLSQRFIVRVDVFRLE